jgi:hypothetical protein
MVRNYKGGSTKNNWTDAQLAAAMRDLHLGKATINSASKTYGIPWTTLSDHFKGKSIKRYGGRATVLSKEEEQEIVLTCVALQELGFGLTQNTVGQVIKDYLSNSCRSNPFTNGIPGYGW